MNLSILMVERERRAASSIVSVIRVGCGHLAALAIVRDRIETMLYEDLVDLLVRMVCAVVALIEVFIGGSVALAVMSCHAGLEKVVMHVLEGLDLCNKFAILLHVIISSRLLVLHRALVLYSPCNPEP